MSQNDDHRVGTEESRPDPERGGILRRTLRRWGLLRVSDQTDTADGYTTRRRDAVGDNLLRCHLFGTIERRSNGLD